MDERTPPPWLPLLRRLTESSPYWGVWKNADAALGGQGDIDSVSAPIDRGTLLKEFAVWAGGNKFSPVFVCPHLPGSLLAVAIRDRRELVELQLCEKAIFRGSTLFQAADLRPLMVMDERGFRRLRPGAEGLLLLFHNGMTRGGRPAPRALQRKNIVDLLRQDTEGMEAASVLFRATRKWASRLAEAVLDGEWDRRSAVLVEFWAAVRGFGEPWLLASRATYQLTGGRYCPLLPILRRGRRLQGDVEAFISKAKKRHDWQEVR
jgi:hypothetical protein